MKPLNLSDKMVLFEIVFHSGGNDKRFEGCSFFLNFIESPVIFPYF